MGVMFPPEGADDEVRWLNEEETEAWNGFLEILSVRQVLDAQLHQESGLSLFGYLVLSRLAMEADHSARMSQLAHMTACSPSRLSNVVGAFEKKGWVTRQPDPDDGRAIRATLTEDGFDVVCAAAPGHVRAVRRQVIDPLDSRQLRALVDIARSIADALPEGAHLVDGRSPGDQ